MQTAVWDTYVKKKNGNVMHFDIIVPDSIKDAQVIYGYGKTYLAKNGETESRLDMKLVMWDVLSADFDVAISSEKCTRNVLDKVRSGSVIVFHDSEKAFPRLEHSLPVILNELKKRGYSFELIA